MKWWVILIISILLIYPVSAEKFRLFVGESYVKVGVNITLAKIDKSYEKAVICVNNEKQILYDDEFTYFEKARLKITDIDEHDKSVQLEVDQIYGCYDCKCEGACLNEQCKISEYDEFGDPINKANNITEEEKTEDKIESIQVENPKETNYILMPSFGIIGGIIGIILVWLLWFRKMSF